MFDLFNETGILTYKPIERPMEIYHSIEISFTKFFVDIGRNQRLVGKFIHLTYTWQDIAYAVSLVNQFMHAPTEEQRRPYYRILTYIKGEPGKGLLY